MENRNPTSSRSWAPSKKKLTNQSSGWSSSKSSTHFGIRTLQSPTDYELALSYFLDELGGDVGFHSEGTPDEAPHLRVSIDAVVSKATGVPMVSEQFICSFLHGHDLVHRTTARKNSVTLRHSKLGIRTLKRLPGIVAGNPGYN